MQHVLIHLAATILIAAMSSGCEQTTNLSTLDGYTVSAPAGAAFAPTKITDEDKATIIQLPAPYHGEPPAFIVMDGDRGGDTVRYRWDGSTSRLIVDRRFKHAVLALGNKRVVITHD